MQLVPQALSQGVKQRGCEADHSPSAEVENDELNLHSLTYLHCMVVIYLSIGTTLSVPDIHVHNMIWNYWCKF
jgi:hypothetical protein